MLALDLTIRTHGWALVQVTDTNPWSYTVGLLESHDHPELMITGLELDLQGSVIHRIVGSIEMTGSVDHPLLADSGIALVEVHPHHLVGDWFTTWANFYHRLPEPGAFLQVAPPSDWFCECHQHSIPRFDLPGPIGDGNRSDRRRTKRNR